MIGQKISRARDTIVAAGILIRVRLLFRRGNRAVARVTFDAMRRPATPQAELDARGIETWHTARAVWRAKRLLPFPSTCLQTALATQMLLDRKGVSSTLRVGVVAADADAHAWVEVGDFVLDDQRIAQRFEAFDVATVAGGGR